MCKNHTCGKSTFCTIFCPKGHSEIGLLNGECSVKGGQEGGYFKHFPQKLPIVHI